MKVRTVSEMRDRLIEDLRNSVTRPPADGDKPAMAEVLLLHLLDTLCFVDEREDDWAVAKNTFVLGCQWVRGQFRFQHLPFPGFVNEVASVYAEIAFNLGYFKPARLLSELEMSRLRSVVEAPDFQCRDTTEEELHAHFGPPSHEVVGGYTTVACYGCEQLGTKWVFFDMARWLPGAVGWLPQPLVRDFRLDPLNRMHLHPVGGRWVLGEFVDRPTLVDPAEPDAPADGGRDLCS